ncbi:SRPBCC family protein [Pseudonocardia sp. KRD-184]|uniref:SRPBCC family protein n=1 Tax=Pseudonocardia oceani TaxID=2792013 RepID=A0ABS6UEL4_9PSEU|nr:SRPBCC family protein [Pseudonocardia oceani]MBW0090196.1 SRPBCC family protein [Pseudonocardia oceani]MBW0096546.1 SRPBCC family protein [Pseudonocardia oceani]MBW0109296.1 SRPBCC family protein [Pseudonocardia oceani]MBW0123368.1 SRPBCC family protein [Pseudonocardia oceani]MBW0130289.1 SRPBCC family protein [Pseudonocardia oceani]
MDTDKKLQATKVIDAPAEAVFAVLSDPNRHSAIDGADSIRGVEGTTPPISGIGQVFTMNMHADDLGDYRMVNSVTAYVPGARVGWAPKVDPTCELAEKLEGMDASGHTFTYDLREVDGGTEVTSVYDWTGVKDPQFEKMFPRVSQEQLAGTLDRLASAM